MKTIYSRDNLVDLQKRHDVLLAIDSDGCVFDSMTVKQRVFRSGVIEFWGLEAVADHVHRVCEWVGLFSPWRGLNRFQLILKFFQSLEGNCVATPGANSPGQNQFQCLENLPTKSLEKFVISGATLSMPELEMWIERSGAEELVTVLEWSREMSRRISELPPIPAFDGVFQCLENLHAEADLIVVSQTTEDALVREWDHAGLTKFVDVIAGAELGSKKESLETSMDGHYGPEQTLMVGDAMGDLEAAREAGCLFFPILPGDEVNSWVELCAEGLERLKNGTFAGTYQEGLITLFNSILTETLPNER